MSKPTNVLFANHVGNFNAGGAEKVLVNILNHLDSQTFRLFLAIPTAQYGEIDSVIPARIKRFEHYIPLVHTSLPLVVRLVLTFLFYPIEIWRLCYLVWNEKIDVLYANSLLSGIYLALVARLTNKPLIYHEHNFVEQRPRKSFRFAFKWVAATAKTVVAISHSVGRSLQKHGVSEQKINIVHNGIEYQPLDHQAVRKIAQKGRQRLGLNGRRVFIVGMVAHFHEWKGHKLVLQTIPIVKQYFPNIVYVFIGRPIVPGYYKSLVDYVQEHGLEENVLFTGFQEKVNELMAAMDILLVASNPEPFGMVVLEGMNLYVPIIALDCGGPGEILEHGTSGILIKPDVEEMASAIRKLLSNPHIRKTIGASGNSVLRNQFLVEFQVQKLAIIIQEVYQQN